MACRYLGEMINCPNIIGFDMGGTSSDISVIVNGVPKVTMEGSVAGYPIKRPIIEINTIGAGGGSIAWIDEGGSLLVGPESAGAVPGPICYNHGGVRPAVTDANVVLGYIDPEYFLGGEMKLNVYETKRRMKDMAETINMDMESFAAGIIRIANANMERAIRVSSVEKGLDPRDFALVAFGGAGALHANALAQALDIPKVIIPEVSSVLSALGLLSTDIRHNYSITKVKSCDEIDVEETAVIFDELERQAVEQLKVENVREERIMTLRSADMRYVDQAYEINIPLGDGDSLKEQFDKMIPAFHAAHEQLYTYSMPEKTVEFVNYRVEGVGLMDPIKLRKDTPVSDPDPGIAYKGSRNIFLPEYNERCACSVYDRGRLRSGHIIYGPAIIEQKDSTTLLLPSFKASVDEYRNLVIEKHET